MVRDQTSTGPGIVEWSLPTAEIGEMRSSVQISADTLDPEEAGAAWCPLCERATATRAVRAADGRRFDYCDGCGLLWHVDRLLGRVVGHRVVVPRSPAPASGPAVAAEVRLRPARSDRDTDEPTRPAGDAAHPLAS